jgi:hypothetical protein
MSLENDPNRTIGPDPYVRRTGMSDDTGFGWGIPLALAAVVLIAGLLFYNMSSSDRTTTASNTAPSVTRPAPVTPAPAPAPKQ